MRCNSFPKWSAVPMRAARSDGRLLAAFVARGDQPAFTALEERYKPMVFRVCRRVLGNWQNAENACQRTFLKLMRKAASLRQPESLKGWLCKVAFREAIKVRKYRKQLQEPEQPQQFTQCPQFTQFTDEVEFHELEALVNEGLRRLPEKIRACFRLHGLEGWSKAETAAKLGLKEGTVASRTARGRVLMQAWLRQHGITYP